MAKKNGTVPNTEVEDTSIPSTAQDQPHSEEVPQELAAPEVQPELVPFIEWARDGVQDVDTLVYQDAGLIHADGSLTEDGKFILDQEGIPVSVLNFLVLGIPVTFTLDGEKYEVKSGSVMQVLHAGYDDSVSAAFYNCFAGDRLPPTRIYQNRNHKFYTAYYPVAQPVQAVYKV